MLVSLLDICDFKGGTQPPKSTFRSIPAKDYIRLLQIQDYKRDDLAVFVSTKKNLNYCDKDDVMIGRYGASIGKIFRGKSGAYNVALVKASPKDSEVLDKDYLFHLLKGDRFQNFIENLPSRAAQAGFNQEDLARFYILLPNIHEQKKLAMVMERLDSYHLMQLESLKLLTNLPHSIFRKMFGDLTENSMKWKVEPFDSVCKIESKTIMPTTAPFTDFLHIGGANIESVTGRLKSLLTAKEEGLTSIKFLVKPSNILFSKIRPKLRKIAYPRMQCICSADIYPLEPNLKVCTPEFLIYYLRSEDFTKVVAERAESRSNIPKVNRDELNNLFVPCPDLTKQEEFSQIVRKVEAMAAVREESVRNTKLLIARFSVEAFKGESEKSTNSKALIAN